MLKYTNKLQVFALILLTSALLLASFNPNIASVKAQEQATVVVAVSLGGTTDPSGTTTYDDGTAVSLTAANIIGFGFDHWDIVTDNGSYILYDNPATIDVSGGVTYAVQAIFYPIQYFPPATISTHNNAIIVILFAVGGTTSPPPGTYATADGTSYNLTATPASGWVFHNWIIGGSPLTHGAYSFTDTPTDNPYNVNHGYGNTYTYQPVFVPVGSSLASPTPTGTGAMGGISYTVIIIALAVVLIIVLIAFGAFAYMKRSKK